MDTSIQPIYSPLAKNPAFAGILVEFTLNLQANFNLLEADCAAGNFDLVVHWAHRLAGSTGSYGYDEIAKNLLKLESMAKGNPSKTELQKQLSIIELMLKRVVAGVNK